MQMQTDKALNRRHLLLMTLFAIVLFVAWNERLDALSTDYLDEALTSAGLIYATARGINALVSVLQGTELDMVILTFTIGEVLDPINDLIERFSAIMLIALGSLAMQKILLTLVSHTVFNAVLTLLASVTVFALLLGKQQAYRLFLRAFMIVVFLRFSLALVVMANHWVDLGFLAADDSKRYEAMENFQGELREIGDMAGLGGPSPEVISAAQARITRLETARAVEQRNFQQRDSELAQAQARLSALRENDPWWQVWNPLSPDTSEIAGAKRMVGQLEAQADASSATLDSIDQALLKHREALSCMQKRAAGESCGFLDNVTSKLSPAEFGARIAGLESRVTDFAENTIALLMSALLKFLVIPLVFLYLVIKLAGLAWSRLG